MSQFGVLMRDGRIAWQVFYGDAQPEGEGWQRVSGSLPDGAKTDAKWFRSYAILKTSKAAADKPPARKVASFWDALSSIKHAILGTTPKQPKAQEKISSYKTGDRIVLKNGNVGYVQSVNVDGSYELFDTRFGRTVTVMNADIVKKEPADPDNMLAIGDTVTFKSDHRPGVVKSLPNPQGRVRIDTTDGKQEWHYPEEVTTSRETAKVVDAARKAVVAVGTGYDDKIMLGTLARAVRSKRSITTIAEIMADMQTQGYRNPSKDHIVLALRNLSKLYPNIVFDEGREFVDISGAKVGIQAMVEETGTSVAHGPFGWSPDPGDGVFSTPGTEFVLPAGCFVRYENEDGTELMAEITNGYIDSHAGGGAVLAFKDKEGETHFIKSDDVQHDSGAGFWELAKTLDGKSLKPDPYDPSLFGDVIRDNFWILRDRTVCQDIMPGDYVKSLPYALLDTKGKKIREPMGGRVLDRKIDEGLIQVQWEDGRVNDISPRMVQLSRAVASVNDAYNMAIVRRGSVYGATFTMPSGARITFGDVVSDDPDSIDIPEVGDTVQMTSENDGRTATVISVGNTIEFDKNGKPQVVVQRGGKKRKPVFLLRFTDGIEEVHKLGQVKLLKVRGQRVMSNVSRIVFPSVEHFHKHYNEFFVKGLHGGWLNLLSSWFKGGRDQSKDMFAVGEGETPPYMPNQALMRTLLHLYPQMDSMSARSYYDDTTREVVIEFGPDDSVGKPFPMANILPHVFASQNDQPGAIRVDSYERLYAPADRVDITSDGNSVFVRLGENLASKQIPLFKALAPAIGKDVKGALFYHAVTAHKKRLADAFAQSNPDLYMALSRFTYDPVGKRFIADLSDYGGSKNIVIRALQTAFGENVPIYESTDRTWWFPHGKGMVTKLANDRQTVLNEVSKAKENETLVKIKNFKRRDGNELLSLQRRAVNFITAPGQKATLLANDQGTGKTPIALASLLKWRQEGKVNKALIVVPASILANWRNEIEMWTSGENPEFIDKDVATILGTGRKNEYIKLFGKNAPFITITSYNTLVNDYKELATVGFDAVVLDEAQAIKNLGGSKREQVLKKVFAAAPFRLALTGTPIENSASDMFSIMEFLAPDVFGSSRKFDNDFIEYDEVSVADPLNPEVKRKKTIQIGVKNIGLLRSKLLPFMLRISKEQMVEAMQKEYEPRLIAKYGKSIKLIGEKRMYPWPRLAVDEKTGKYQGEIPPEHEEFEIPRDEAAYPDFWKAHRVACELMNDKTVDPLVRLVRLQQAADDPALFGRSLPPEMQQYRNVFEKFDERNSDGTYKYSHPKRDRMLKVLKDHLKDPANGKVIVFSNSTSVLEDVHKWIYSDPEMRKLLGVSDRQYNNVWRDGREASLPGVTKFVGGMKSNAPDADIKRIVASLEKGGGTAEERALGMQQRKAITEDFQNPRSPTKILLASDAAQTGLTLTQANLIINYNLNWNPQALRQRSDRAHRIDISGAEALAGTGGARDVTVLNLIMDSTADKAKVTPLAFKAHLFDLIVSGQANAERIVAANPDDHEAIIAQIMAENLKKPVKEADYAIGYLYIRSKLFSRRVAWL